MHAALCRKLQQEKKEEGIYNYKHAPVLKNFTESSCLYLGAGMWAWRQLGKDAGRGIQAHSCPSMKQVLRAVHTVQFGIATALSQEMGCVGFDVFSHDAIATITLNPAQLISCER